MDLSTAHENSSHANEQIEPLSDTLDKVTQEKDDFEVKLKSVREQAELAIELEYKTNLKEQTFLAELKGLERNLTRLRDLVEMSLTKQSNLLNQVGSKVGIDELEKDLEINLSMQLDVENDLESMNKKISDVNLEIQNAQDARSKSEEQIEKINTTYSSFIVELEGHRVRKVSVEEQIQELDIKICDIKQYVIDDIDEQTCTSNLKTITNKISRLGPINLAAIDEYTVEKERFDYHEQQSSDLQTALDTLLGAISKIDLETKHRFEGTFNTINENFKVLFPKLFGGGKAQLYLTSNNLLETGVGIIAKPPGKKVANILALSGGEKALTAVALVFAIFQLNPSPFCLLDEVDAPLDDANVVRFCNVIKEMSDKVQFIVITHNKVTMEMADQLSGVTMQEPGVSRLVSVDVEAAVTAA